VIALGFILSMIAPKAVEYAYSNIFWKELAVERVVSDLMKRNEEMIVLVNSFSLHLDHNGDFSGGLVERKSLIENITNQSIYIEKIKSLENKERYIILQGYEDEILELRRMLSVDTRLDVQVFWARMQRILKKKEGVRKAFGERM
jgi:hypothetical protein